MTNEIILLISNSLTAVAAWFVVRKRQQAETDNQTLRNLELAVNLYKNYLKDDYKLSQEELRKIILGCYEVEKVFVEKSTPDGLQGITKDDMVKYVQYVTDIVLNDFGCEREFKISNPLEYMSRIGLSSKNNFFEKREGEYTRVDIPTTTEGIFDEEF